MRQICKFNKKKDVGKVILGLAPDLQAMIDSHNIPETSAEVIYNQIEDVKGVGVRINDDFEAIMLSRVLHAGIAGLENNGGTASSGQIGGLAHTSEGTNE